MFILINMKATIEYKDYRQYMQDFYDERKKNSAFSWREFSKLAGFASPTYLKLVCEGKSSLSKVKMMQVAKAMNLAGFESDYFAQLVIFGNAKTDSIKKAALLEMERIAREHKVRVVDSDAFQYYESWENPVIRELAPMMPGAQPHEIAEAINEDISAEDVRRVLIFLTKTGFLKKQGENKYSQTEKNVIGSKEALPIAIRAMHREMAEIAAKAVDRYSPKERHFLGITLGVNEKTYSRITQELESCCKKIVTIASGADNSDQVYRLNMQFFPFTKKISSRNT
jgi:uncharacterized protein (TIGR02147 family)